jgi:ABC-type transporter Mla MlaB component
MRVLKISWVTRRRRAPILKLEGELVGPWVELVRDACAPQALRADRAALDLSAVTFADAAGAALLRDLTQHGMAITASSRFIAELLQVPDS